MTFKKLTLEESLFDDDMSFDTFEVTDEPNVLDIDDNLFSILDDVSGDEHSVEDTLPGPKAGADTGVASELIALINDEWEAIQGYNNAIASLRAMASENSFYADAINVLEEISAEENRHVGQLQEVLKHISPNANAINKGEVEAQSQLRFVDGKLPVQTHEPILSRGSNGPTVPTNDLSEDCTLDNCDDEF